MFSTIEEISSPMFLLLTSFSKLVFDFSSIDKGETATGKGFKLPLVISTSISANELFVKNIITNNDLNIFYNTHNMHSNPLTFLLHQNLIVTLSIFHIQYLVL